MTPEQIKHAKQTLQVGSDWSMHTRRVLNMSTAHITETTDAELQKTQGFTPSALYRDLSCDQIEGGWLFYIDEYQASLKLPGHEELENLIELAYHLDYDFLMLYQNADPLPKELGLPTFEW